MGKEVKKELDKEKQLKQEQQPKREEELKQAQHEQQLTHKEEMKKAQEDLAVHEARSASSLNALRERISAEHETAMGDQAGLSALLSYARRKSAKWLHILRPVRTLLAKPTPVWCSS